MATSHLNWHVDRNICDNQSDNILFRLQAGKLEAVRLFVSKAELLRYATVSTICGLSHLFNRTEAGKRVWQHEKATQADREDRAESEPKLKRVAKRKRKEDPAPSSGSNKRRKKDISPPKAKGSATKPKGEAKKSASVDLTLDDGEEEGEGSSETSRHKVKSAVELQPSDSDGEKENVPRKLKPQKVKVAASTKKTKAAAPYNKPPRGPSPSRADEEEGDDEEGISSKKTVKAKGKEKPESGDGPIIRFAKRTKSSSSLLRTSKDDPPNNTSKGEAPVLSPTLKRTSSLIGSGLQSPASKPPQRAGSTLSVNKG